VMALYGVLGDLTWAIAALLAAIVFGLQLLFRWRSSESKQSTSAV